MVNADRRPESVVRRVEHCMTMIRGELSQGCVLFESGYASAPSTYCADATEVAVHWRGCEGGGVQDLANRASQRCPVTELMRVLVTGWGEHCLTAAVEIQSSR